MDESLYKTAGNMRNKIHGVGEIPQNVAWRVANVQYNVGN